MSSKGSTAEEKCVWTRRGVLLILRFAPSFLDIKVVFLVVVVVVLRVSFVALFLRLWEGRGERHRLVPVQVAFQAAPLLEEPGATCSSQLSIY